MTARRDHMEQTHDGIQRVPDHKYALIGNQLVRACPLRVVGLDHPHPLVEDSLSLESHLIEVLVELPKGGAVRAGEDAGNVLHEGSKEGVA